MNDKKATIDFSKYFAKSTNYDETVNQPVHIDMNDILNRMNESRKDTKPTLPIFDFSKVGNGNAQVVEGPIMAHPNDPNLDIEQRKANNIASPIAPLVMHNPVGAIQQSELYRQQQQMMYARGQQYLANRGPISYHINNPSGLSNVQKFQDDMNKKLNSPTGVMEAIIPQTQSQDRFGFVPINQMSAEEYKDTHYEREKKERESFAESAKKLRSFGNPNRDVSNESIPKRRLPYSEMVKRVNNINTPTAYENFRVKQDNDGGVLLKLSSNNAFSNEERNNAFNRANSQYEAQKQAILSKPSLVYNNTPRFYNPNDYTNYISSVYPDRPKYYPGYGYGGIGMPDENGLPTVWYNDGNKYLSPTQKDIENQNMPIVHSNKNGTKIDKTKKEKKSGYVIITSRIVKLEDGTKIREIYNMATNEVKTTSYNEDSDEYEDYSGMRKDSEEQLKEDDTTKIATELSRYNIELADIFAWCRNGIEYKDFLYLKRDCLDQLIEYRDADPLSLIKSTVLLVKETALVLKPKPITLEELDLIINSLELKEHSSNKLYNIYKRYLIDIKNAKTLKDKLKVIWSARDIEVIPRDKDKAFQKAKEIIKNIKDSIVKTNYDRYRLFKSISRSKYGGEKGVIFEKDFAAWWNKPRASLSKSDYETRYNQKMNELNIDRLANLKDYDGTQIIAQREEAFMKEWERLSEGRFHKPNMTFSDYVIAMNVTSWNIAREEQMKRQYDAWKNTKTDTTDCKQSIVDKVLDQNIERLGLSQVTKLPRYAPVSLSGIDKTTDLATRRAKFIERLLSRQRRPMI